MTNGSLLPNKKYAKKTKRKNNLEQENQLETIQLVEQAKEGNKLAEEILVKSHMQFIKSTVIKCNYGADNVKEDAFQEGVMGFLRAIENYDVKKGAKFSSYAYY